jgi:hypothetical protein
VIVNGDARWCLRSLGDADTHRNELSNDDTEAGVGVLASAVASRYPVSMTHRIPTGGPAGARPCVPPQDSGWPPVGQLPPHRLLLLAASRITSLQAEESTVGQLRWVHCLDDERRQLLQSADVTGGGHQSNRPWPEGRPVSSPAPDPPVISADAAARMLCDYFLANAERGDNAANDEFVAELALRLRTGQAHSVGASFPRTTETTAVPHRGLR